VKILDLKQYQDLSSDDLDDKSFGRYKDGFYYIQEKVFEPERKYHNFELYLKGEKYTMDSAEKFDDDAEAECCLNEKGDKLLVKFISNGTNILQRFNVDAKEKKLKSDYFEMGKGSVQIQMKPLNNDFALIFKKPKDTKSYIYINDALITSYEDASTDRLDFNYNDKALINILIRDHNEGRWSGGNTIKYKICELSGDKDKKEWVWQSPSFEIYNIQHTICFPYAYCIYNHD
jgi:hypothetical protein